VVAPVKIILAETADGDAEDRNQAGRGEDRHTSLF
jgi:hypothetical protein